MTNPNPVAVQAANPRQQKPMTVKDWLNSDQFKGEIAKALPSLCTPDRFLRVALTAMTKTPKLADCDPKTVLRCFLDCASLGIEPDNRRAYLIPFKTSCTLVIGYQGLVELARRSGMVAKLHADVVCEHDVFEANLGEITRHVVDYRRDRGQSYAVYALAVFKDGSQQCAIMPLAEIHRIRDRSNAVKSAKQYGKETPWDTDFDEMAKKTALRRLCKLLPLSPEIQDAIEKDEQPAAISASPEGAGPLALPDLADDLGDPVAAATAGKEGV